MIIHLFRHGQVDGPAALYGKTDVELSSQGAKALEFATAKLDAPDAIISSPLRRCQQFAQSKAEALSCPLIIEPGIREMDFGLWDGQPYREDSPQWPSMREFWQQPADVTPPEGESLEAMNTRVTQAWQRIITTQHERLWVIAHGGTIRLIIAHVLGLQWQNPQLYSSLAIGYASRTDICCDNWQGQQVDRVLAIAIPTTSQTPH